MNGSLFQTQQLKTLRLSDDELTGGTHWKSCKIWTIIIQFPNGTISITLQTFWQQLSGQYICIGPSMIWSIPSNQQHPMSASGDLRNGQLACEYCGKLFAACGIGCHKTSCRFRPDDTRMGGSDAEQHQDVDIAYEMVLSEQRSQGVWYYIYSHSYLLFVATLARESEANAFQEAIFQARDTTLRPHGLDSVAVNDGGFLFQLNVSSTKWIPLVADSEIFNCLEEDDEQQPPMLVDAASQSGFAYQVPFTETHSDPSHGSSTAQEHVQKPPSRPKRRDIKINWHSNASKFDKYMAFEDYCAIQDRRQADISWEQLMTSLDSSALNPPWHPFTMLADFETAELTLATGMNMTQTKDLIDLMKQIQASGEISHQVPEESQQSLLRHNCACKCINHPILPDSVTDFQRWDLNELSASPNLPMTTTSELAKKNIDAGEAVRYVCYSLSLTVRCRCRRLPSISNTKRRHTNTMSGWLISGHGVSSLWKIKP